MVSQKAQEVSESLKKIEETGLSPALESIDLSTTTDQSSHPATEKDHEIDHEPMPASLVNFQQQLNEYQNRNSFSIEDDRDVWGKEDELSPTHPNYGFGPPLPNSPPLEVDSESEERSHDSIKRGENEMENAILSPNSEKSSYLNEEKDEKTNISNENVDEYPSISRTSSTNLPAFRPPQPQPKVKSIIDSLPNHAT
ncbi:hypothetical protein K502DRAFT_50794 [Neoconidiobolus thromboides FSU 785]|nr:hypothetical protein K502DRAFT_50794 [Neoconidiobolus thromboides FSU 785]